VLVIGGRIGGAGCIAGMRVLRMDELDAAWRVLRRNGGDRATDRDTDGDTDGGTDGTTKSPQGDPP
jgi:hypothetical protein